MMKYYYSATILLLILSIFTPFLSYSHSKEIKPSKEMVVIIDPGHGGKDPGAISNGIREKDVVLGIGLKLGKLISETFPDVKVIYTRHTDVFIPLIDRSRIANKNKSDLFISIHANFCGTPSISGTETYVLGLARSNENLDVAKKENSVILLEDNYRSTYADFDPNSSESYIMFETVQDVYMDQSLSFADDIQHQFKSEHESSSRGVKQAGFLVLRESSMPSVLVETGFVSNASEARYLMSEQGEQNIAHSILEAFRKFKSKSSGPKNQTLARTESPKKSKSENSLPADSVQNNKKTKPIKDSVPAEKPIMKEETKTSEPMKESIQLSNQETKEAITMSAPSVEKSTEPETNVYFSIQIAASINSVKPVASNFKGLKNVRSEKNEDKYYRYFVGKENSLDKIAPLLIQIKQKFPQAFIVSFVAGKRVIINNP